MAENESALNHDGCNCSEAVCIDAMRIYDSCSDKDCLEDIRVIFTQPVQEIINNATNVRIRDAQVLQVCLDLQPIPFNRGFYSVDMTFYFNISLDVFSAQPNGCTTVSGVSVFNKKVILFGSEGNVKMFSSDSCGADCVQNSRIMPKATVQVARTPSRCPPNCVNAPRNILNHAAAFPNVCRLCTAENLQPVRKCAPYSPPSACSQSYKLYATCR